MATCSTGPPTRKESSPTTAGKWSSNRGEGLGIGEGNSIASKEGSPKYKKCATGRLLTEVCDLYEATAGGEGIQIVREFEKEMGNSFLDPAGIHSALCPISSPTLLRLAAQVMWQAAELPCPAELKLAYS